DLYFNRKHEQKEISGLPIDKAREYLQEGLEGRIERQLHLKATPPFADLLPLYPPLQSFL
ncbi:hypothetical protein, partial [Aeromonas caviae]|uniref:hypothetical protein n=1 Tax=Aeromonas caviae TaxID=648 RepID=UPI001CC6827F